METIIQVLQQMGVPVHCCSLRCADVYHGLALCPWHRGLPNRLGKLHLLQVSPQSTKGGEGGGIPPLDKIPYEVKLHPPPSKIAPYVVHPPLGFESLVVCEFIESFLS